MIDKLKLIKQRHENDQELYRTINPKILEQMRDYYIHQDRKWLIDRVEKLEVEKDK